MKRFVEGQDRSQSTLFPESLEDYIAEDNPVPVARTAMFLKVLSHGAARAKCSHSTPRPLSGLGWPTGAAISATTD